jgi:hypothetical protein
MKASHVAALLAISCLGGITAFPDHGRADDILIEATGQTTWKAGGSQSDGPDNPLIVLAKKDDVLEIKALAGPHGFATLNKKGNESPAVEPKFVVACGETPDTKPDAVFLETECNRNRTQIFPNIKLKVSAKHKRTTHLWRLIHRSGMWGTIRPRP